ncbi:MAG: tetratricopeptide repeat protein [Lysobacteraceae bacterium]
MDHLSFRFAIGKLTRLGREQQTQTLQALEAAAEEALRGPDPRQACSAIQALLQRLPKMAKWWRTLGSLHLREGNFDEAREAMRRAIQHAGHDVQLLHRIGRDLEEAGIAPCELAAHPPGVTLGGGLARWPEGTLDRILGGDLAGALPALEFTYRLTGSVDGHARNLAFVYRTLGDDFREQCVEAGRRLAGHDGEGAVTLFEALDRSPLQAGTHLDWKYFNALRLAGRDERLFQIAEAERESLSLGTSLEWSDALLDAHRDEEAAAVLGEAGERFDDWRIRIRPCIRFPAVPLDAGVVNRSLARMRAALDALEAMPLPVDRARLSALADVVSPNFHLPYQVDDEADLRRLARLTARVIRAELPQYSGPQAVPAADIGKRRIRIGYAASVVRFQTVVGYFINWFRQADRERFELHLFPLEDGRDALTGFVEQHFDVCHPPSTSREQAAGRIAAAGIDILVHLEVGMSTLGHALSSLRLAPVQCLAAGHPMTSGMDSIDYFLSPDSMEPEDAQAHYSERLQRLPGVGVCMPARRDPTPGKTRADFDLEEQQVVFTSPQSLWKYRPGDEHAFARVAAGVDNAIVLFVEEGMPARTRTFTTRLRAACDAAGVDFDTRMRISPRRKYADYLALLQLSDAFLDSFHWSGGVTTFDALALGVPVVTLPGTRMRGRQSYGMLKELGIEDTIAKDVDDYVRIAHRLGKDAAWRQDISGRILANHARLFDDQRSIHALEAFYLRCVGADPSAAQTPSR